MPDPKETSFALERWLGNLGRTLIDKPVTLFRETVVDPIQSKNKYYYYHRKYRRVPNVDECPVGSEVCLFEANEQFKRDRKVDLEIVGILKQRQIECQMYYGLPDADRCLKEEDDWHKASTNWFIKYGDMGPLPTVLSAYMKQKNRLLWERRHGPVGSGKKPSEAAA